MGSVLKVKRLALEGAAEITTDRRRDDRGWFARFFCQRDMLEVNGGRPIQQANCSHTVARGTVRGLHFQYPPHAEDKAVRCIQGRVFDVMVDLRRASPTFGQAHSVILDAAELNMVYVPRGFAHGFQTIEDHCEILYLHTEFHAPTAEGGFRYDSPALRIDWPLPVSHISVRDSGFDPFVPSFEGLVL